MAQGRVCKSRNGLRTSKKDREEKKTEERRRGIGKERGGTREMGKRSWSRKILVSL
jgi:hypothetical protein